MQIGRASVRAVAILGPLLGVLSVVGGAVYASELPGGVESVSYASHGEYGRATTFQVAVGDLDGDGDLDAVFANQGSYDSRVLLNDGAGTFVYTEQRLTRNGHGVALGDLDGDGDLDVVIACAYAYGRSMPSRIYFNDGHAGFEDSGNDLGDLLLSGNLTQLVDIDVDGDLDVFMAYMTVPGQEFISRVYLNDGHGRFAPSEYELPFGSLFSDLNGDGAVDVFIKEPGEGYRVLLNDGVGGLSEGWRLDDVSISYEPFDAAFGDLDGDGDVDVLDTNGSWTESGSKYFLAGDGTGAFERRESGILPSAAAWPIIADLNGDGRADVLLSLIAEENQVWLNAGDGRFVDSGVRLSGQDSRGAAVGDLNADGKLDLFIPVYGMVGGPSVVWLATSE